MRGIDIFFSTLTIYLVLLMAGFLVYGMGLLAIRYLVSLL